MRFGRFLEINNARENIMPNIVRLLDFLHYCNNDGLGGKLWLFWRAKVEFEIVFMSYQLLTRWCNLNDI